MTISARGGGASPAHPPPEGDFKCSTCLLEKPASTMTMQGNQSVWIVDLNS